MARKQKTYTVRDTSTKDMGNGVKRTESVTVSTTSKGFPFKAFLNVNTFIFLFLLVILGSSVTYFISHKGVFMPSVRNGQPAPYETLTGDEALIQYMADRGVALDKNLETPIYEG